MECMRRCQAVHDLRRCPVDVGSPQTKTQRDQVTRIINRLIAQSAPATITNKTAVGMGGSVKALTPNRSKLALSAHHSRNNSNGSMTSIGSAGSRTGTSNSSSSNNNNASSNRLVKSSSKSQFSPSSSSSTSLHALAQASPGKPLLPPSSSSSSSVQTASTNPAPSLFGVQIIPSHAAVLSLPGLLALSTAKVSTHQQPPSSGLESPGSSPMVHKKIRSDSVLEGNFAVGNLIGTEVPIISVENNMEMMAVEGIEVVMESKELTMEAQPQPGNSNTASTAEASAEAIVCEESMLTAIHIDVGDEQVGQQHSSDANPTAQVSLSKSSSSGSCEEVKEFSGLHLAGDFTMEVTPAEYVLFMYVIYVRPTHVLIPTYLPTLTTYSMGPRSLSKEDTVSPAAAVSASPAKPMQSRSVKGIPTSMTKPPLQQQQQQSTRRFIVKRGNNSQPIASINKAMVPVPPSGLIPSSKTSLHSLFSRKEDN